jgi:hypothetical protein
VENIKLDRKDFLDLLSKIGTSEIWFATISDQCIHIHRRDSNHVFTPLTAVYFQLTGVEIHRGSFWCEEMQDLGFPWWDINAIEYATIACGGHDPNLRMEILKVLGFTRCK